MLAPDLIEARTARMEKSLKKRLRAEHRFRLYGITAVGMAGLILVFLLTSIFLEARTAFTRHEITVEITPGSLETRSIHSDVRRAITSVFTDHGMDAETQRAIGRAVTVLDVEAAAARLKRVGRAANTTGKIRVPLSDTADQFLQGRLATHRRYTLGATLTPEAVSAISPDNMPEWLRETGSFRQTGQKMPLVLMQLQGGTYQVQSDGSSGLRLKKILGWQVPERTLGQVLIFDRNDSQTSKPNDREKAVYTALKSLGMVKSRWSLSIFAKSDSNEPELAGLYAAMVGSIMIIFVTMLVAVPVGVGAAIYLEEFARKTRLNRILSANINNLASVPSIVFGLLGAAILISGVTIPIPFTHWQVQIGGGMARGWPLVCGLVLALMVLPTIIITSRAAIASVPNRIREAGLSLGASRLQVVMHHVLPRAVPGILTGSIISLAQAIGEAAPLLLLGVFAFIGDAPDSLTDRSSALPVLIYQWSGRAEQSWLPLTAAAIVTLLFIMLAMNAIAIWIRMKYDRKNG